MWTGGRVLAYCAHGLRSQLRQCTDTKSTKGHMALGFIKGEAVWQSTYLSSERAWRLLDRCLRTMGVSSAYKATGVGLYRKTDPSTLDLINQQPGILEYLEGFQIGHPCTWGLLIACFLPENTCLSLEQILACSQETNLEPSMWGSWESDRCEDPCWLLQLSCLPAEVITKAFNTSLSLHFPILATYRGDLPEGNLWLEN